MHISRIETFEMRCNMPRSAIALLSYRYDWREGWKGKRQMRPLNCLTQPWKTRKQIYIGSCQTVNYTRNLGSLAIVKTEYTVSTRLSGQKQTFRSGLSAVYNVDLTCYTQRTTRTNVLLFYAPVAEYTKLIIENV